MSRVSADEIEALKRELNIQKTLKHDNIVKLYNAFEAKGFLYIILEYVEKGNLFEYMKANRLTEDDIVSVFGQVTSAINYLHKQKILHRDIKPENILMKDKNFAKLCDFGFCAPYGNDVVRQTMCGTTEYLPPEIIGREDQNDKVDIWCLGVLLYEMTHSKTPFEGQNIHMLQFQQKKHNIKFKPDLNPQLRTIVEKCLEFEPSNRPTAEDILSFPVFSKHKQGSNFNNGDNQRTKFVDNNNDNQTHFGYEQAKNSDHGNQSLQNYNSAPAPNLYQQPLIQQYMSNQHQAPNIYSKVTSQSHTSHSLPLRADPSPQRILYKNDMFKKQRGPERVQQEPAKDPKVVKYSVTRITRDGREITETRSTSQTRGSSDQIVQNNLRDSNNIRTVRVVAQNASVDRKIDPSNFYKQFSTVYSNGNSNMYAPSHNQYVQANPFITRNIYQNPHDSNTAPAFYKQSDRQISAPYTPKEFKYSYNKPGPEKPAEPKMSYHVPNTHYTYNTAYNDNGIKRVGNSELARFTRNNNGQGLYAFNSANDKSRSRSQNDGISVNGLTTRIVRQR